MEGNQSWSRWKLAHVDVVTGTRDPADPGCVLRYRADVGAHGGLLLPSLPCDGTALSRGVLTADFECVLQLKSP